MVFFSSSDNRGPISKTHRTYAVPFDEKLRKKKKFKKILNKSGGLHQNTIIKKFRNYHKLFHIEPKMDLKDNAMFICREGEIWRTAKINQDLKCYHLHHGDSYLKLGPFLIEEKSINPLIILFKDIFHQNEIQYFKSIAQENLRRSTFGGLDEKKKGNHGRYV